MKRALMCAVALLYCATAHAETIVTDVTSCTSSDAMTQYTKDVASIIFLKELGQYS